MVIKDKVFGPYPCDFSGDGFIKKGSGQERSYSCHSEIKCIKAAKNIIFDKKKSRKMSSATMYNIRARIDEDDNIIICNSMPCAECKKSLLQYNINNVIYTDEEGSLVKEKTCNIPSKYSGCRRKYS